ncbi:MAG: polyprenyl synthetase family protein [Phycisphaerales bacterium]|nr:polyprenyl synthetase family protein [Phycisphaerales bacterium]
MPGLMSLAETHEPISLWIADQLDEVSQRFERQLASELPAVNALCAHVERYRGKMLRPTMVLLSGLAASGADPDSGAVDDRHRIVGAVVEMIHMATLVHDDVLDDADVRRRGRTVNALHGNETAVMLGDYLISNAFHLCSSLGDPTVNLALGAVTNTLCAGELIQLHHRNDWSLDEATYEAIVERKTASLIAEGCRLGATLSSGDPDVAAALHAYGRLLGIAFQIQDDLLDITGEQAVVGKSLGRDLEKGKLTLPVILLLDDADARGRGRILRAIEERDATTLRDLLVDSGAMESTHRRAAALVDEARSHLPHLPASSAREVLDVLADAVITRAF